MSTTLKKSKPVETRQNVVILFAGDSGDGIQLTGSQFTDTNALFGNDVSTFPNFPAEIRAPQGTLAGVSGYQLHFGSVEIFTPGDQCDVLVVMNAAALKANLGKVKKGGTIIANTDGFDKKNLRLAGYIDEADPLTDGSLVNFQLHSVDVTKLTRTALEGTSLGMKEKDRCKNMFILGFINWMYSRENALTEGFLRKKFSKKPDVLDANMKALVAGYNYGETSETFTTRFEVKAAPMPKTAKVRRALPLCPLPSTSSWARKKYASVTACCPSLPASCKPTRRVHLLKRWKAVSCRSTAMPWSTRVKTRWLPSTRAVQMAWSPAL